MEEPRSLGGGDSSSSRATSSFEKLGDRTRFTVEIRPGETTIVSWKKLVKDASKVSGPTPVPASVASASAPEPSVSAVHPSLESRLALGQPAPNELKDGSQPNRFNSVIEKIERLYMGKDSSDDEDLGDIPDDQYDTEDSFIDDAELDEYFEVDKLKTKHDGFFINRGKLESLEPSLFPTHQQKKRRRKEMVKGIGESDEGCPHKNLKVGKKGSGKTALSVAENKLNLNGDTARVLCDRLKETTEFYDSAHMKYYERNGSSTHGQEIETSYQQKEKSGKRELIDLNVAASKHPITNVKSSLCYKREGSNVKPKGNTLDRAIKELEKSVAESRPYVADLQDSDAIYLATKRRLPQEIKQKLAKVARVVQLSHGKLSQELLNRLMGILGHIINLRTLKRNLKIMISASLSVNQEKDNKFQQTKKEVIELIKEHGSSIYSKPIKQQPCSADEFQESHIEDKGTVKMRFTMDPVLEDKISDLYDIFVDGLDDDVARQARKLYAELAELWPKGAMDNHGIKRAICHAKERRKIFLDRNKDEERIKAKKLVAEKVEESQADSTAAIQPQYTEPSSFSNMNYQNNKPSFTLDNTTNPTSVTVSFLNPPIESKDYILSKHEKIKGESTLSHIELRKPDGTLVKKKIKRKNEANSNDVQPQPEKVSGHSEERPRSSFQFIDSEF